MTDRIPGVEGDMFSMVLSVGVVVDRATWKVLSLIVM